MPAPLGRDLPNRILVRRILREGRSVSTPLGRIIVGPENLGRHPRALVVAGKTVSKKSTVRNRAKRRIAAWARHEALASRMARSIVILAAPPVATMSRAAFRVAAADAAAHLARARSRIAFSPSR
ncbi:ribonuclease P protein component [Candidatus Parcubacteria bacterium]|nr:MAG: ribonuclease P protein component [Candidatus Parcubacteria bacterium]